MGIVEAAQFDAAAREAAEGCRNRRAEDRLAAGKTEGEAAEHRQRTERGDERQDAYVGDQNAVDEAAQEPDAERGRHGEAGRAAGDEHQRRHDAGETRNRADAQVEIAHRHHHRHRRRDDGEHAHLLRDVERLREVTKVSGNSRQKKRKQQHEAERRAEAAEKMRHQDKVSP